MQKEDKSFQNFMMMASGSGALMLTVFQLLLMGEFLDKPSSLSLFIMNVFHLSFALLFLLEFIMMKTLGHALFAHKNRKIQSRIILRMTFIAFSLLYFNAQSLLIQGSATYVQNVTEAFFFALFLSGGIVYMMLWGINWFFEREEKIKPKESIRLYGICSIEEFEAQVCQLSNALYALSKIEEDLSQESIARINQKTKELYSLFPTIRKMSSMAKKEVAQDVLDAIHTLKQELETILYSKDEKYVELVKRKTAKINRKTVR